MEFLQNITGRKHRVHLSCYVNFYLWVFDYLVKVEGHVNYQYIGEKMQVFGGITAEKKKCSVVV